MIRRPPRSTLDRSSAASDVYKRQGDDLANQWIKVFTPALEAQVESHVIDPGAKVIDPVSYTHLRAHETVLDLVCRLLLEKKKNTPNA